MNNSFKDKVQAIAKSTSSDEVRAICESYLSKPEPSANDTTGLITSLVKGGVTDGEMSTLRSVSTDVDMSVSREAAAAAMKNWKGGGSLGHFGVEQKPVVDGLKEKALLEQMSVLTGTAGVNASSKVSSELYGIREAVEEIESSQVVSHHGVHYAVARFRKALEQGVSESLIARDFLSAMSTFSWDATVASAIEKVKARINEAGVKMDVQIAAERLRNSDRRGFFSAPLKAMNEFCMNEGSAAGLEKQLTQWTFNPIIKDLATKLRVVENSGGKLGIPVGSSEVRTMSVHSPVHFTTAGGRVFKAGKSFYLVEGESLSRLSKSQVNALPKAYHELCEAFFTSGVKVKDGEVIVKVGKSTMVVSEGVKVDGREVADDKLFNTLSLQAPSTIFENCNEAISKAMTIASGRSKIYEIDTAKGVFSSVHEGAGSFVFRLGSQVYVTKVNESMGEEKFYKATAAQAVDLVRSFLGYDMSEAFTDLLTGSSKKAAEVKASVDNTIVEIQTLEEQVEKIEKAAKLNPALAQSPEILEARSIVTSAIAEKRAQWNKLNDELASLMSAAVLEEEGEPEEVELDEAPAEEAPANVVADEVPAADEAPAEEVDAAESGEGQRICDEIMKSCDLGIESLEALKASVQGCETMDAEAIISKIVDATGLDRGAVSAIVVGGQGAAATPEVANAGAEIPVVQADPGAAAQTVKLDGEPMDVAEPMVGGPQAAETGEVLGAEPAVVADAPDAPDATEVEEPAEKPVPASDDIEVEGEEEEEEKEEEEEEEEEKKDTEAVEESATLKSLMSEFDSEDEKTCAEDIVMTYVNGNKADFKDYYDSLNNAGKALVEEAAEEICSVEQLASIKKEFEKSGVNESLKQGDRVKLKGNDDVCGEITGESDSKFSVLWDNGENGEYEAKELEGTQTSDLEAEAENVQAAAKAVTNEASNAEAVAADREEEDIIDPTTFMKATVKMDFGPYKEGDEIEVSAVDYTSSGDDDPLAIKDAREDVASIPKKMVKIMDEAPAEEVEKVEGGLDSAIAALNATIEGGGNINVEEISKIVKKLESIKGAAGDEKGAARVKDSKKPDEEDEK